MPGLRLQATSGSYPETACGAGDTLTLLADQPVTLRLGFWQDPNSNPSHTACDRLQASGGAYPAPLQALLDDLLALTAPGRQPPLHWRYALLANLALILLLPPPDKARPIVFVVGGYMVFSVGAVMLH